MKLIIIASALAIVYCAPYVSQAKTDGSLFSSNLDGVYGGMGRHLSKLGPYTMDLTGATLGTFIGENLKLGFPQ